MRQARIPAPTGNESLPCCALTRRVAPARGASHRLFGSLARGGGKRKDDIDILIESDPQALVGFFEYVGITQYLADLSPTRLDVAKRSSLKPLGPSRRSSATRFMAF